MISKVKLTARTLSKTLFSLGVFSMAFAANSALAQTIDFGGPSEAFGGRKGDRTPPRCTLEVPRAAEGDFFVSWFCTDRAKEVVDITDPDSANLVSELFIIRRHQSRPDLVETFLGFPASVGVTLELLKGAPVDDGEVFTDYLPVSFRLVVRDRAGNATLSPVMTVSSRDLSVTTCDLLVTTEATEADGGTTGMPSLTAFLNDATVSSQMISDETIRVFTIVPQTADPCEIDEICGSNNRFGFDSSIVVDNGSASGTVVIESEYSADVTGSASIVNSSLESLSVAGDTDISGVNATVELDCSSDS